MQLLYDWVFLKALINHGGSSILIWLFEYERSRTATDLQLKRLVGWSESASIYAIGALCSISNSSFWRGLRVNNNSVSMHLLCAHTNIHRNDSRKFWKRYCIPANASGDEKWRHKHSHSIQPITVGC